MNSPKFTVVTIHGLLRSRRSMSWMARRLTAEGYHTLNFGYLSFRQTISQSAAALNTFLEQHRHELGESIHFVTHSLGGLVVRAFANDFGDRFSLGRCVMLGPPNKGAKIAEFLIRFSSAKMLFGPALTEIAMRVIQNEVPNLEVGVIAGTFKERGFNPILAHNNDFIVRLDETFLPGQKDHLEMTAFHGVMMRQPSVARQVVYFLRNGLFLR